MTKLLTTSLLALSMTAATAHAQTTDGGFNDALSTSMASVAKGAARRTSCSGSQVLQTIRSAARRAFSMKALSLDGSLMPGADSTPLATSTPSG